jgi:hypothetical protein
MKKLGEDYTVGVLRGIPIFCVNRYYKTMVPSTLHKAQYIFEFENGYGASVIEFEHRIFSGGYQYEMLANIPGVGGNDIERGDERDMHKLLCELEQMHIVKSIDN